MLADPKQLLISLSTVFISLVVLSILAYQVRKAVKEQKKMHDREKKYLELMRGLAEYFRQYPQPQISRLHCYSKARDVVHDAVQIANGYPSEKLCIEDNLQRELIN